MERLDLFPTPVWSVKVPSSSVDRLKLLEGVQDQFRDSGGEKSKSYSLAGSGWRGAEVMDLLEDPLWRALGSYVFSAASELVDVDNSRCKLISTGVNLHLKGGANRYHVHPQSILSCVYYLAVGNGAGDFCVYDPRPAAAFDGNYSLYKDGVLGGSSGFRIKPYNGLLLMMPAWLPHSVDENLGDERRISMPINIVPRSFN